MPPMFVQVNMLVETELHVQFAEQRLWALVVGNLVHYAAERCCIVCATYQ